MFCHENLPAIRTVLSTAASLAASAILFKTIASDLIPAGVHDYLFSSFSNLFNHYSSHLTVVIEESDGLTANQMFEAANIFLGAKLSPSTRRIKVKKPEKDADLTVTVDRNQPIIDVFGIVKCTWVLQTERMKNSTGRNEKNSSSVAELRYFELSFHKKHRETVLKKYLPFVLKKAKEIKEERRAVKLHTVDYNGTDYWSSVILNHPATFETMAMDLEKKKELLVDLDMFIRRKDYYRRVGRAWKRGYLFYGQPGTGKSSLVAAMANYLKFDVYDLDLREVQCNSDLRRLLIGTKNRSILVIEDIDCNIGLQNRDLENETRTNDDDKITLSGLLNFIDGLWSSCGDEQIIVFTTNHKDRLDPALLRPGRMDVHLEMSYCTYSGFKTLASNYLQLNDEEEVPLFGVIKELLKKVQVTPAEIAGELMKNNNVETALKNLVYWLQTKDGEHANTEMAHSLT